ncbi:MAG: restriction endonuclease [Arcicella sp.]|jgi:Holliday junction resolvase-like predicted endonuclease/CheY-like chemotaxis protein|nr:restriction endonuclease [Arcicella sp.]
MKFSILHIDDQELEGRLLKLELEKVDANLQIMTASAPEEMQDAVENYYYHIAIVDLQYDNPKYDYKFDGIEIIKQIVAINPMAKIIVVSGYTKSFTKDLNELLKIRNPYFDSPNLISIIEKGGDSTKTAQEILVKVQEAQHEYETMPWVLQTALESDYADAKNEMNSQLKGKKFERFVSLLFGNMGFQHIQRNIRDKSNEIDLIIRNDISDPFFEKFSSHFLVECKNYSERNKVDKNAFDSFEKKLKTSHGMTKLGFLITSNSFAKTIKDQARYSATEDYKVILLSNIEIIRILRASNRFEVLKNIISEQVRVN